MLEAPPSTTTKPLPPSLSSTTFVPKIETTAADNEEAVTNVHGYITCSSENNEIEINLRFPKCKCSNKTNESSANTTTNTNTNAMPILSSSSLNQTDLIERLSKETNDTSEIKTKIINFNHENLVKIISNLNIDTCTKCNISVDVRNLLKNIFSSPKISNDHLNGDHLSGCSANSSLHTPRQFSDSNISATSENEEFIVFQLNKKDHRSTGTQHEEIVCSIKGRKKHKIALKKLGKIPKGKSFKSMEDLSIQKDGENHPTPSNGQSNPEKAQIKDKNRSKSVDDISASSNEMIEGVDSVELIFISDEFLNKANKQEVIIVDDPFPKKISPSAHSKDSNKLSNGVNNKANNKKGSKDRSSRDHKKLYVISDDFKNKSLNNTVIVVKQKERIVSKGGAKSPSEPMTLNLKTTATDSNTFLTYEEPWSPVDDLEKKNLEGS